MDNDVKKSQASRDDDVKKCNYLDVAYSTVLLCYVCLHNHYISDKDACNVITPLRKMMLVMIMIQ
jgi:hypothetical protein